ncbi:MAG: hypothetical protein O7B79_03245, partial [SAR324 cluster bacterium]|nr:hypothetical protein [SAR324 cluster bacterium]
MFVSGDFAEAVAILRELWDGRWREARHADLRLAERWARFRHPEGPAIVPVNSAHGRVVGLGGSHRRGIAGRSDLGSSALEARVFGLGDSENMWLQRSALQLKCKQDTDRLALGCIVQT